MSREPAGPTVSRHWLDPVYRWRDRLLASPAFQARAARIPLIRRIALRRAEQLHALTAGFVYSQVLFAGIRLGLFQQLLDGPLTVAEVAARLGMPASGAERLLLALAGIGLVERRAGNRFGLGELGAATLGNPGIGAMVEHHQRLYADLADPVALLRERGGGELAAFWTYAGSASTSQPGGDSAEHAYSDLMSVSQGFVAGHVLASYDLGRHQHLLDVAGGDGSFAAAALSRNPGLKATVFDLPPVAALAGRRLAERGLASRATAVSGDMLRDALPGGADIVSLVRVLHDHDDEPAQQLLRSAHRALSQGGRLLIAEPMAGTRGAEDIGDTYFGMYLWAMGSGRPRTAGELTAMALEAGFSRCREYRTSMPLLVRVLVAEY